MTFTLSLTHPLGPKSSRATEIQTLKKESKTGNIYFIEVDTTNHDIPYADDFFVRQNFCLVKLTDVKSR